MILTLALSVMVVVEGIVIIRLSNRIEFLRDRLLKQMRENTSLKMMKRQKEYIIIEKPDYKEIAKTEQVIEDFKKSDFYKDLNRYKMYGSMPIEMTEVRCDE